MDDQARVELFQNAVKKMEGFKRRGDDVCASSQYGDSAMVPASVQEPFNETLKDFLQAGVDVEKLRGHFLTDEFFSMAGSGKSRYRGIPCSTLSRMAGYVLQEVEGFQPKAKGATEADTQ